MCEYSRVQFLLILVKWLIVDSVSRQKDLRIKYWAGANKQVFAYRYALFQMFVAFDVASNVYQTQFSETEIKLSDILQGVEQLVNALLG